MSLPDVVTREEWLEARQELLAKEKQWTRERDALSTARRELPMVEIEKEYAFEGPEGPVSLLDLFDGRRQLMVRHFMFDPEWEDGCPSCSAGVDEISDGLMEHLNVRDTTMVIVGRAPLPKIAAYKAKRGWKWPFYSSYGSDFNYDFDVTLDRSVKTPIYNYREVDTEGEWPGLSCFVRDGDRVFHTYSHFARGTESVGGSYYFLDQTVLGRQEEWEKPPGRSEDARAAEPNFKR